jgi:hypothetical protein
MAAQVPDRILLDGEHQNLYSNPLESFWNSNGKKRPAFFSQPNCERGYRASWEIRSNQLFLADIEGYFSRRFLLFWRKSVPYTLRLFRSRPAYEPVKASWFSGKLRIPQGKMTRYEHSGYDSRFEKEIIMTVEKGNLIKVVTLDYTQHTLYLNAVNG